MKLTADNENFRHELLRQLYLFPVDDRYTCLFRLSEISALALFANCIFIYTDKKTNELKLLKREWNSKDLSFAFAPGVYQPEKLKFNDTHHVLQNKGIFEEMVRSQIETPLKPEGIILDGTHYCLRIVNGERVAEKYWQLPRQLTGTLKELVSKICEEAGPFQY